MQIPEDFRQMCGLQVPAEKRGDQVGEAEDVEAAREDGASDAV